MKIELSGATNGSLEQATAIIYRMGALKCLIAKYAKEIEAYADHTTAVLVAETPVLTLFRHDQDPTAGAQFFASLGVQWRREMQMDKEYYAYVAEIGHWQLRLRSAEKRDNPGALAL